MPNRLISFLRAVAACLLCLSGLAHIAALWHRELTGMAIGDALLGAVYLIIALGLFGQSRFSLFLAVVVPALVTAWLYHTLPLPGQVQTLRMGVDLSVALLSALVLWSVRNNPTQ